MGENKKSGGVGVRVCPGCGRAFYARAVDSHSCPMCGYMFIDRRVAPRSASELSFTIEVGGKKYSTVLKDYSGSGIRIELKNRSIEPGAVIQIDIKELAINKRCLAVWTRKLHGPLISAGLSFLRRKNQRGHMS